MRDNSGVVFESKNVALKKRNMKMGLYTLALARYLSSQSQTGAAVRAVFWPNQQYSNSVR